MNILAPTALDPRQLYKRSALQVGLLTFATLGLYLFVWSFFTLRSAKALLEDESEQPVWWSLGLVLPLFNLFAIFRLFDRVKTLALRAQLTVPSALGALGLVWIALGIAGRFSPVTISSLSLLAFLPVAYSQLFVERAELVLSDYASVPKRFSWIEIVVLVL